MLVANALTKKPHKVVKNILASTTTRSVGSHFKTGQSIFQPSNRGESNLFIEYSGLKPDLEDYVVKLDSRPIFTPSKFLDVLLGQPFRRSLTPKQIVVRR
jgi:hypothetical protein